MSTIKFGELYHGFEIRNPRNARRDGGADGLREFRDTVVTRLVCGGVLTGIASPRWHWVISTPRHIAD